MEIKNILAERKQKFALEAEKLKSESNTYSVLRVVCFCLFLIAFVYFANQRDSGTTIGIAAIFPFVFGGLVRIHNKIKLKLALAQNGQIINERELNVFQLKLDGIDQGTEFEDTRHNYTSDLNIFGKHSLFQLLNRNNTVKGKQMLASWLRSAATKEEISQRQEAAKELSQKIEWLQTFQSWGLLGKETTDPSVFLYNWIAQPGFLKRSSAINILSLVLPIFFPITLLLVLVFELPASFLFIPLLLNGVLLRNTFQQISKIAEDAGKTASALRSYSFLLKMLETENFSSQKMQSLKSKVQGQDHAASKSIDRLAYYAEMMEIRSNPYFYALVNPTLLWDFYWLRKLESWKEKHGHLLKNWLEAIHETESMISLGSFALINPNYSFPQIQDSNFEIDVQDLSHPLISNTKAVSNTISSSGSGKALIITGSNMSGKSTFMRTLGINAVLAYAGAPVSAQSMKISIFEIYTAMHMHDSLEENASSFYAELKRIKGLLDLLTKDQPVFYLLDELLKGTNTVDRNKGAAALITQLLTTKSTGLISTHDLELGKLAEKFPGKVENFSFNSKVEGDEIIFDYKLDKGICHSFNATKLMEKMGIKF